jgi:thioester reductase-like protein
LRILVTGAAGLLGAEVTDRLARQGHAVVGLVHRTTDVRLNNGRRLPALRGLPDEPPGGRVALVAADVRQPRLGLSEPLYERLRASVDVVVHSAAVTDFGHPPELYEAVNVGGTAAMLDFVAGRRPHPIPIVHVSTAYVCGERQGTIGEDELEAGQGFANPYERSKFRAERLVREAGARGVPFVVARPSIIVGTATTGQVRDFKTIYVVLRVTTDGRVRSIPGNYDATLDLVPVDAVAAAVARLAADPGAAAGRTLHLVAGRPTTLRDFSDVLAEYPSFHVPRFVSPHAFDVGRLPSLERRFYLRVIQLYEGYFARRVTFARDAATAWGGFPPTPCGKPFLRRLIDYGERVGYLGARPRRHGGAPVAVRAASLEPDPDLAGVAMLDGDVA